MPTFVAGVPMVLTSIDVELTHSRSCTSQLYIRLILRGRSQLSTFPEVYKRCAMGEGAEDFACLCNV